MARGKNISQETLNWVAKRDADRREKFNQSFTFGKTPQEWEKETGNKLLSYQTSNGKLMKGNMAYQSPEQQKQGQIGQSFGRMIGGDSGFGRMIGGGGGMGGLEAASMRLADAAAAREMRAEEAKFARERGAQASDQEASDKQSEIASLEQEFSQVSATEAATPAEKVRKNERLSQIRSAIQGARSELANVRRRGRFESFNMASQTRFM